jgi:hypothetical protein
MRPGLLLILFSILSLDSCFSQGKLPEGDSDRPKKNVVFICFWVNPLYGSIMGQYERVIIHNSTSFLNSVGIRLGIGSLKEWYGGSALNGSTDLYTSFGKKTNHLEIGAGVIYTPVASVRDFDLKPNPILPSFTLSYRYQRPLAKRISHFGSLGWTSIDLDTFVLRAGVGWPFEWLHLSLGYCF